MKKNTKLAVAAGVVLAAALAGVGLWQNTMRAQHTSATYAMSTTITQMAYGPKADAVMEEVNQAFAAFENRLSLFKENSEIAAVNAGAGIAPVKVSDETFALLQRSLELSASSDGAFDITIAPLTLLWGITTDTPKVPTQAEIDAVLPLIDDASVQLDAANKTVYLPRKGMAIDLGGIAKGNACTIAQQIYEKDGLKSAVLNIGGNVYIRGRKPDGSRFRVGFRTPEKDATTYIASIEMEDQVMAVSGAYERYFIENGVKYHHILSSATGYPADSDVVSVGVVCADGTRADFLSTTLFVWGVDKTTQFMRDNTDVAVLLLTDDGRLLVSSSLKDSFKINEELGSGYEVVFI